MASFAVGTALMVSAAGLSGQEKGGTKEEGTQPPVGEKAPKKFRGQLPTYWGQLGLSEGQKQNVYAVQAKYKAEIDKLEKQIEDMKTKMGDERLKVLTPEQKKRLEDIIRSKVGGGQ